jgi:uncharacterized protein YndB with AHSA1/START domain
MDPKEAGFDAETSDHEIVVSRIISAPRENVWKAITEPKQVSEWWGPLGFSTKIEEMQVRPDGIWKQAMFGPDGTKYPNQSVFTDVEEPERLSYSHVGGREQGAETHFNATWRFEAIGANETRVTMRMVFDSAAERDRVVSEFGATEGAKQSLARLSEHLAKIPVVLEQTFKASRDTLWHAITDVEQMRRWYFADLKAFRPEVGFQTRFNVRNRGKDYLHIWKVIEVEPGRKITYSWKFAAYLGESFVTFELSDDPEGSKLVLRHEGLETFLPDTNPDLSWGNFMQGWTYLIGSSLKRLVDGAALWKR